jgi:hypothetical protein
MADLREIVQSPDFRRLDVEAQRSTLNEADPGGFGSLTPQQQNGILGRVESEGETQWFGGDMSDAYVRGLKSGVGQFAHIAANVAEMIDDDSEAGQYLRSLTEEMAEESSAPEGRTYSELAMSTLGNLTVGLPVYAAAMKGAGVGLAAAGVTTAARFLAPMLTFGTIGALSEADKGFQAAMFAGSKEAAFGALFGGMHYTGRAARASVLGSVAYKMTPEDLDPEERIAHGLTMAILGGLHAKPKLSAKDIRAALNDAETAAKTAEIEGKMAGEKAVDEATEKYGAELAENESLASQSTEPPAPKPTRRERELSIFIREAEARVARAGEEESPKAQATLNKLQQERATLMRRRGAIPPDPVVVRTKHEIEALRERLLDNDVMENPDLYLKTEAEIKRKQNYLKKYAADKKKMGLTEEEAQAVADVESAGTVKAGDEAGKLEVVKPPTEEAGGTGDPPGEGGRGPTDEAIPLDPVEQRISDASDVRRQEYLDQSHGFLWADKLTGILDTSKSMWKRARQLLGMAEMQDRMITEGHLTWGPDPKNPGQMILHFKGKGMGDILKPIMKDGKKNEEAFKEYGGAIQAEELIWQFDDPKVGIRRATPEEVGAGTTREKVWDLERIERGKALETEQFKKTYEEMKEYNKRVKELGIELDFFTEEQAAVWKRNEYAWSMARVMDVAKAGGHRTVDRLMSSFGVKKLHGSKRNTRDAILNFIRGPQDMVRAILHNKFTRDTMDHLIKSGGFATKISAKAERIVVGRKHLIQAMKKELMDTKGMTEKQAGEYLDWLNMTPETLQKVAFFIGAGRPYGDNIVSFIRKGKVEYYDVPDQVLYRAFEGLNPSSRVDLVGRWMANFKDFKQSAITLDPSFIFGNFIRDPAMALVMTRTGNKNLATSLRGLKHVWTNSPEFVELMANGLGGSPMRDHIAVTGTRLRRQAMREEGGLLNPKSMVFGPGDVVRFMSHIGRAIELGPRVGEALRARDTGIIGEGGKLRPASMTEAVFAGREVSTDFRVRGGGQSTGIKGDKIDFGFTHGPQIIKFMGDTVPFFNAMMAGMDRGFRAVARDPHGKAATAVKMGLVGVSSVVLYGINRDMAEKYKHLLDKDGRPQVDFNNLPDWATTAYWHFYIPTSYDEDTGEITNFIHMHMPKLWEVGMIGSWGERFAKDMYDGEMSDKETLLDLMTIAAHNFNINTAHKGVPMPLPAGIDVLMEQAMNRILFTGSPIETMGMGDLQDWARARSGQSRSVQAYGELVQHQEWMGAARSPARAEALLRGIFGNWASMGMQLTDTAFFPGGPAMGFDDIPALRRIYSEAGKYDRNTAEYYKNFEEFRQAYATMRERAKIGEREQAKAMRYDPDQAALIRMAPGFDRANRKLQGLNREILMLRRGVAEPLATPRERHHSINRVEAKRNRVMKMLNEKAEKMKKKTRAEMIERQRNQRAN